MSNDVAIFLDLDNLVIGAKQADLVFDIDLALEALKELTGGRIVLRQAYGAGRQSQSLMQEMAEAGFEVQSATRINKFGKNLADMQIVVNAMDTLIDGHEYSTYVFMSGDRDFTPLVQALRKRGKTVIGIGVRHTTSKSLAELCDQYIYYEDLVQKSVPEQADVEQLLVRTRDELLDNKDRVRASVFKQHLSQLSEGMLSNNSFAAGSFSKYLRRYPHIVGLLQDDTTIYVTMPGDVDRETPLHLQYRSELKKQRLRVVPSPQRFAILHQAILCLNEEREWIWGDLLRAIHDGLAARQDAAVSKTLINAMLLVAREAGVLHTLKGRSLPAAPVLLQTNSERAFQEAVICCDSTYMHAILNWALPFDLKETAVALYDAVDYAPYLQRISTR
jgi:uncharacterized LabA/DUF88 family protein